MIIAEQLDKIYKDGAPGHNYLYKKQNDAYLTREPLAGISSTFGPRGMAPKYFSTSFTTSFGFTSPPIVIVALFGPYQRRKNFSDRLHLHC